MKSEIKIEDLRIGQVVWFDGEREIIESLTKNYKDRIAFGCNREYVILSEVQDKLSLTPPKKTKRYWQWKLKPHGGCWLRSDYYFDNKGYDTSGMSYSGAWEDMEKHKIEDDFIDVEVSE
jgi:hypothetical protein